MIFPTTEEQMSAADPMKAQGEELLFDNPTEHGHDSKIIATYGGDGTTVLNVGYPTKKEEADTEKKKEEKETVLSKMTRLANTIEKLRIRNEINALLLRMHNANSEDIAVSQRMKKSEKTQESLFGCGGTR